MKPANSNHQTGALEKTDALDFHDHAVEADAPHDRHMEPDASTEKRAPRDGMSKESVMFKIEKCTRVRDEVYDVENKGRYFVAKVKDHNGRVVKEMIVDKLSGGIRFIR